VTRTQPADEREHVDHERDEDGAGDEDQQRELGHWVITGS
jgi:hypothetical protein